MPGSDDGPRGQAGEWGGEGAWEQRDGVCMRRVSSRVYVRVCVTNALAHALVRACMHAYMHACMRLHAVHATARGVLEAVRGFGCRGVERDLTPPPTRC